jgi:hypothetical protein
MANDSLKAGPRDRDREAGGAGMHPPEAMSTASLAADAASPQSSPDPRVLDPRVRRGSLGPPPAAAPLDDAASRAALHAHLVHLLDARHDARLDLEAVRDPVHPAAAVVALPGDQQLGPHEDLERQPDGVPHIVIGLTALFSVALAALLIGMFHSVPGFGSIIAIATLVIALPLLVFKLGAKADRDRDHDHPSR